MGKNKKGNLNKKNTVEKEIDTIKKTDFEGVSDNKKVIIIALVLALLIGGFAYVRSLDKKTEKPNNDEEEKIPVEEEKEPVVEETPEVNNNYWNNYYPVTTPQPSKPQEEEKEPVNIWEDLEEILESIEAGSVYELPNVVVDDEGEELTAVVTYKFKTNEENSEYTAVTEFDSAMIGKYLITYTLNYKGGNVDTKDVEIEVVDTVEPIINGITNEALTNKDVTIEIVEYSPYKIELDGVEYNDSLPIIVEDEGEHTITVTEDIVDGKQSIVKFTIDKTEPKITGIEDKKYYNDDIAKIIDATDENLDSVILTKDSEVQDAFEKGVTEISEEGKYEITVTDLAGNSTVYTFVIDRTLPVLDIVYTPNGTELVDTSVNVVITADEEIQGIEGWTLGEDKLTLTKEFIENATEKLVVKDLAGNITEVDVVVDYIDYNIKYTPTLTIENLVANKVKATITSIEELTILTEGWVAIENLEDELYKYEKIYDVNGIEKVEYEDALGNPGEIEVNIEITLTAFVEYVKDTDKVTAFVTTEEEVLEENIPEGWTYVMPDDPLAEITEYKYYKEYTETVIYELVEFVTLNKHYAATIVIDMDAPVVEDEDIKVEYEYTDETETEKTKVEITITADEKLEETVELEDWTFSEDKKSISQIIDKPTENVPTEEQKEEVTITDLSGNNTKVEYTYDWN